jgi:galactonate dehydratase
MARFKYSKKSFIAWYQSCNGASKMQITELETILAANWIYVKVHTDVGIVGIGEAGLTGRAKTVEAAIKELTRYLKGKDPLDIELHWQAMYRNTFFRGGPVLMGAISAIDIALWDIAGKYWGAPIHRLLGGRCRSRVRVYVHLGDYPIEGLVDRAVVAVKDGYTAIRWAPFTPGFERMRFSRVIDTAVSQVKAVREAVGQDVDICLDAHGRLSPFEAIAMAKELEPYRVFFFEDPILPENIDAMADVARHTSIPIATGERLYTIYDFECLLNRNAARMVRPDLSLAGGISQCRKIAAIAEAHYAGVIPHCPLSAVSLAACIQLDAAIHNFTLQEYIRSDTPPRSEVLTEPLKVEKGYLLVPDKPGLGIEFNDKLAEKYPYLPRDLPALTREDGSVADW